MSATRSKKDRPAKETKVSLLRLGNPQRHHLFIQGRPAKPQSFGRFDDLAVALREGGFDQMAVESCSGLAEGFLRQRFLMWIQRTGDRSESTHGRSDIGGRDRKSNRLNPRH